jgi:hypothetical protein
MVRRGSRLFLCVLASLFATVVLNAQASQLVVTRDESTIAPNSTGSPVVVHREQSDLPAAA